MRRPSELRLQCPAQSCFVPPIRHALAAFLEALGFERDALDDVTTAAGEALANVVEHAYTPKRKSQRDVQLFARLVRGKLSVDVYDRGSFIFRDPLPGRGFGLRIARAIAHRLDIETSNGTRVRMTFPGAIQES